MTESRIAACLVDSLDVGSAVLRLADLATWGLITCVDSDRVPARLSSVQVAVGRAGAEWVCVGSAVAVPVPALAAVVEAGFFNGFDEVWLFRARPAAQLPDGLRLTSDGAFPPAPQLLAEWLHASSFVAGLGDGDGLRVVHGDPRIASRLGPVDGE